MAARLRYLMLLATLLVAASFASAGFALDTGDTAPTFELAGIYGPVKLSRYQGKVVYLDFWASWCGPCRQSFPWMNELQSKFGAQGLQIIGINLDAKNDDAHRFLATTPASFLIAYDPAGATPRQYQVKGMPSSFLIGPDGKIIFAHAGFRIADKTELENRIRLALKGNQQ